MLGAALVVALAVSGFLSIFAHSAQTGISAAPSDPLTISEPSPGGWIDHFDILDNARWCRSSDSYAPFWTRGGLSGTWKPAAVTVEDGHLVLRTEVRNREVSAAEVYTCQKFGFGTYEALVEVPALNGVISAMMSYADGSQTEIDFEFEGRDPDVLHTVTWTSPDTKEHSVHVQASAFPRVWTRLRYEWRPMGVEFFINDMPVAHHRKVVPSAPAHLVFNLWPTDDPHWGGPSTDGTAVMRVDWVKFTPAAVPPVRSGEH
jgi:endo-1,3-1,4-beta-glycanase ExoK